MGGGHVSRPDFGMAQPDPAHPLTEFYQLVQQALDKAGCFALPALYARLQAPARRIYPEEAREYLRLAPQAGEGFVRLQAAVQMPPVYFCLALLEAELFVLLSAEMGLALGLVLPNLHWTSEAAVIKMSGCTLLSMAANLVAVLVLTLAQTNLLTILPLPAVMAAALVLLAGADGLLGHWLKTRGARRLAELS